MAHEVVITSTDLIDALEAQTDSVYENIKEDDKVIKVGMRGRWIYILIGNEDED